MIVGMTIQATTNKIKRSFTLAPESAKFLSEIRQKRKARSESEALDMLLRESMLAARQQEIEAAYTRYYDSAREEDQEEQREWAEMAGPGILRATESTEAGQ
jgi:hypothetical protein